MSDTVYEDRQVTIRKVVNGWVIEIQNELVNWSRVFVVAEWRDVLNILDRETYPPFRSRPDPRSARIY